MRLPVVMLVLALLTPSHVADVAVRYLVDDEALKGIAPGSALNPTLFTDAACTHALFGATLPITGAVVSRLKLFKPKHGPKVPKVDLMTFTMTGVPPYDGALYLVVTGPGVVPVDTPCQVQGGTAAAPPLTTSTVTVVDENGALGFRIRAASDPLIVGVPIVPVTREAAAALVRLTSSNPFDCTIEYASRGSALLFGSDRLAVFNAYNCAAHVPSCTDGLKNQDETDIDCGGSACSRRCGYFMQCSGGGDCDSGACPDGRCGECNVGVNATCGGTCAAKCPDGLPGCSIGADCQSGLCMPLDGVFNLCAPARCSNGIKDGPETDIDCGGLALGGDICGGCPAGKTCASAGVPNANCVSQVCTAGVCH